ncbi:hypothetical protein B0F90DRAFT_1826691 [Multifurca ochricompacta]|uniref:F-box domain-containing protein n=1 Tax=Multifurca ochricompacta TaxID=376703 RepID=A0AAD4LU54_9AGAM|nr:hypothetical protein B0F90DRAFT_1826691 [Multifurca ochricompacta]
MSSQQSPNPNRATSRVRVLRLSPTGIISNVNGAIRRLYSRVKNKKTGEHGSSLHAPGTNTNSGLATGTGKDHECVTINSLPDDVLLEIFNRHQLSTLIGRTDDMWKWHRLTLSDVPGPAQSRKPGQAGPVWAGPSQAVVTAQQGLWPGSEKLKAKAAGSGRGFQQHIQLYVIKFSLPKAAAWAKPGQGQAVCDGFGSAQTLGKPEPPQAKPKPRLLGQAGPEHHYSRSYVEDGDVSFSRHPVISTCDFSAHTERLFGELWTYDGFWKLDPPALKDEDKIIAALEHPARTYKIQLTLTKSLFDKLVALKQQPFPALEYFRLMSLDGGELSTLPSTILCESAPRLRILFFDGIPFPMLPKFLLLTKDLVVLNLVEIPSAGYFSPESLVTSLSGMTQLEILDIGFASPSSHPNRRSLPPLRRAVLSTLTDFRFRGISGYLEDIVAGIDAPALGYFDVQLFNQPIFDVPQLYQFISRAEKLRGFDKASLESSGNGVSITLSQPAGTDTSGYLMLWIACNPLNWQVSSIAEICNQSSPLFSHVENLNIHGHVPQPARQEEIGATEWLELFRPFTAVRSLYVSESLGPLVAHALEDTADGPVMEVLPALQLLDFRGSRESAPVEKFVTARQPTLNVQYGDFN